MQKTMNKLNVNKGHLLPRHIVGIILIKVCILLLIKSIWFDAPRVSEAQSMAVTTQHLLGETSPK